MAVNSTPVYISDIFFNMYQYDYSDPNGNYPEMVATTLQDTINKFSSFSIFVQMAKRGINRINLRDTDGNVIGYLEIGDYAYEYCTLEDGYDGEHHIIDEYSLDSYPEYSHIGSPNFNGGVRFKAITGQAMRFTISIDGVWTTNYYRSRFIPIEYYDSWGNTDYFNSGMKTYYFPDSILPVIGIPTIGLMSRTRNGVTHNYLNIVEVGNFDDGNYSNLFNLLFSKETNLLCDNLSITDHEITEDGYMDELENRFSPRYWTNAVGMYVIPAGSFDPQLISGMELNAIGDIMKGLMERKPSDALSENNSWVGTDGKEYVLRIRWYYGIKNNIQQTADRHALQIGPVLMQRTDIGPYYYAKIAVSEYVKVVTDEMFIEPHYNNYLDMLTSYQLYLPYYGFLTLDPNDVVGAKIKVYYHINIFTGACNIVVTTKSSRTNNVEQKTYSVNCNCGTDIPFTTDMYNSMALQLMNRGKEFANAMSGSLNSVKDSPTLSSGDRAECYVRNDNGKRVQVDPDTGEEIKYNHAPDIANAALQAIGKQTSPGPTPSRSGGFTQENGNMDELFPYLLITRPIDLAPSIYEDCVGSPSFYPANLGSITGFTKIIAVDPSTAGTPPKYLNEIIAQLQAGVYL